MRIRVVGSLFAGLLIMTHVLVAASTQASSPERPSPSPRTFVAPTSCVGEAPCPQGYWVFRAADCEYYDLRHAPGTVLLLESGKTLQCRCRLAWLLTKEKQPPVAKVWCDWLDLEEARLDD